MGVMSVVYGKKGGYGSDQKSEEVGGKSKVKAKRKQR